MTLRDAWENQAPNWIAWARRPGHDSYWRFHRDVFLRSLPPAPRSVLDVGCGEGRLPRDLKARGYQVVGLDGSSTLIASATDADPGGTYLVGDASRLPFGDAAFELVVAFMSLQDIDDPDAAVGEMNRVLIPGGRLRAAIVHPMNSAGGFEDVGTIGSTSGVDAARQPAKRNVRIDDAPFVIRDSYLDARIYDDPVERDGLTMDFTSLHRPLQAVAASLLKAGFLIDHLVEVTDTSAPLGSRWQRIPLFLHVGGVKPERP